MIDLDGELPTFLRKPPPRPRAVVVLRDPIVEGWSSSWVGVLLYRLAIAGAVVAGLLLLAWDRS